MGNPQLDQFTHGLMWKIVPIAILAGFVSMLPKGRRRRSRQVGSSTGRSSGWAQDLVLAPWWVSFGLAIVVSILLPNVIPVAAPLTPIIVIFLLCLCGISVLRKWKTRRMFDGQTGLDSIRELPWKRFEDLLGEAYRRQGYKVEETLGGGADGGVDLVLRRNGDMTLVQCKRWKDKQIPVQTVRELYGLMHDRHACAAKVIATTTFTPDAVAFASGKPIELVDSNALLHLLQGVQSSGKIVIPSAQPERDHLAPDCPLCGSEMKMREARRGLHAGERFWGCSRFPVCRGTREI